MALTAFGGFDNDIFGQLIGGNTLGFSGGRDGPTLRSMPIDVVEKKDKFEIKADVPGVSKSDINLDMDSDVLSISVSKSQSKTDKSDKGDDKWHRSERTQTFVRRSVRLPDTARLEDVKAKYSDGVLTIDVPKDEKKPKTRSINVE